MSDWTYLNRHRVTEPSRTVPPRYCSTAEDGFNGLFRFNVGGRSLRCIASDGGGWQHVSVSEEYSDKPVPWGVMCAVKALFWDPEDVVVQYHPAESRYVNFHKGCLHMWRPTAETLPVPPDWMVGPKGAS